MSNFKKPPPLQEYSLKQEEKLAWKSIIKRGPPKLIVNTEISQQSSSKGLLEEAEFISASRAIGVDQSSSHYQAFLNRTLQELHTDRLMTEEKKFQEELSSAREKLRSVQERQQELRELVDYYKLENKQESEKTRHVTNLIRKKAQLNEEIESTKREKPLLQDRIDGLHEALRNIHTFYTKKEREIVDRIHFTEAILNMSEKEKLDKMLHEKEELMKNNSVLKRRKKELLNDLKARNEELEKLYIKLDREKDIQKHHSDELKKLTGSLQAAKSKLEVSHQQLIDDKALFANNKNTLKLTNIYEEPTKNNAKIQEILERTCQQVFNVLAGNPSDIEPSPIHTQNEDFFKLADAVQEIRDRQLERVENIKENTLKNKTLLLGKMQMEKEKFLPRDFSPMSSHLQRALESIKNLM